VISLRLGAPLFSRFAMTVCSARTAFRTREGSRTAPCDGYLAQAMTSHRRARYRCLALIFVVRRTDAHLHA